MVKFNSYTKHKFLLNCRAMDFYFLKRLFFVTIIILPLFSCKDTNKPKALYMSGSIRETFVKRLQTYNQPDAIILLNSGGGLPSSAMLSVQNMRDNRNDVAVIGACLSACAEYLLPAANSIKFRGNPLVGFHWNAIMSEYLMRKNAYKDIEYCTFSDSKKLATLQKEEGLNSEFWLETFKRLGRHKYTIEYHEGECPWRGMKFENSFWLPTSQQLRELYKLEFTGSVCADDYEACKKKIDRRWRKGRRFMVGDRLYIAGGGVDKSKRIELDDFEMPEIIIED